MYTLDITQDSITPRRSPYNNEETGFSIYIDAENESIGIDELVPGESGMSFREYHGYYMTVTIGEQNRLDPQKYPNASDLVELIATDEAQALIQRVIDGFTTNWDGNNMHGRYNEDAQAAAKELEDLIDDLDRESYVTWDADDWLQGVGSKEYGITAETTDEQLASIAETIVQDAYTDGGDYDHVIVDEDDVLSILTGWRQELIEEAEDND